MQDHLAADFTNGCAKPGLDALKFSKFSQQARAIGAQSIVTVNYGTGMPAWAGAWVTHAKTTSGQAVAEWEIGNENYGCWEPNQFIPGMTPTSGCPVNPANPARRHDGTGDLLCHQCREVHDGHEGRERERSARGALAIDGTVGGASVADNTEWNDAVLGGDAQFIGSWTSTGTTSDLSATRGWAGTRRPRQ